MDVETETTIRANDIGVNSEDLCIVVRHDNDYEYGFAVTFGCTEVMLTSADLRTINKCFNKALRVRKEAA